MVRRNTERQSVDQTNLFFGNNNRIRRDEQHSSPTESALKADAKIPTPRFAIGVHQPGTPPSTRFNQRSVSGSGHTRLNPCAYVGLRSDRELSGFPHPRLATIKSSSSGTSDELENYLVCAQDLSIRRSSTGLHPRSVRPHDPFLAVPNEKITDDRATGITDHQCSSSAQHTQTHNSPQRSQVLGITWPFSRRSPENHSTFLASAIDRVSGRLDTLQKLVRFPTYNDWSSLSDDNGTRQKQLEDSNWPLYVPTTSKIPPEAVIELLAKHSPPHAEVDGLKPALFASRWLTDEKYYQSILRGLENSKRPVFRHSWPADQLQLLLSAGILQAVHGQNDSKAFVKIFSVPEPSKKRRRLIIEPRSLNIAYRHTMSTAPTSVVKMELPSLSDIERLVATSEAIRCIDFKSYYYQFSLGEDVKKYFRAVINGELYQVAVLPQGACFSCALAQNTTLAIARKNSIGAQSQIIEGNQSTALVYIDNIFWTANQQAFDSCGFDIGYDVTLSTGKILGVVFDCQNKSVDITEKLRSQIDRYIRVLARVTIRDIFVLFGAINFAARVLHRAMCKYRPAMLIFTQICRSFMLGHVELSTNLVDSEFYRQYGRFTALRDAVAGWSSAIIQDQPPTITVFTDASNVGGAYVVTGLDDSIRIFSWKWSSVIGSNTINVRELLAILFAVRTYHNFGVHIVTDSQVAYLALKKGWSASENINKLVGKILSCLPKSISWIPSELNPADEPSRSTNFNATKLQEFCTYGDIETTNLWYAHPEKAVPASSSGYKSEA